MDELGPDAALQDIEGDIMFYTVMINTLDHDAPDYAQQKAENEGKLARLHSLLASRQKPPSSSHRPQTPHESQSYGQDDPRSGSFSLPSRQKPSIPRWNDEQLSPSHRSAQFATPAASHALPRYSVKNDFNNRLKRERGFPGVQLSEDFSSARKSRRTSEGTSASTPGTPHSLESLDDVDFAFSGAHKSTSEAFRRKMEQNQRQQEERWRREREDAELARQLSNGYTDSNLNQLPQAFGFQDIPQPTSSQQHTQALIGRNGSIQRAPKYIPASFEPVKNESAVVSEFDSHMGYGNSSTRPEGQRYYNPSDKHVGVKSEPYGYTANMPRAEIKHDPYSSSQFKKDPFGSSALASMNRPDGKSSMLSYDLDSDSDEVQVISPEQFLKSRESFGRSVDLTRPDYSRNTQQLGYGYGNGMSSSRMPQAPGAFPSNSFDLSNPSVYAGTASSWNNSCLMNTINNVQHAVGTHVQGWMNDMTTLNGVMTGNWNGLPSTRYNPYEVDDDEGPSVDPYGRLHAHGLDYLMNDPKRTAEDLHALLENIRPDEDLPPELRGDTPKEMRYPLMGHQKLGLTWLKNQEESKTKGGILADDMGLGKTIQAIALIVSRPSEDAACRTTLIIAPVSLLSQWKKEIEDKVFARNKLSVYVYHGGKAKVSFAFLSGHDIVLTTYGKLGSELKIKTEYDEKRQMYPNTQIPPPKTGLALLGENSKWYRVILDEAQQIKNRNTKGALAAHTIKSQYRLCMTGTPMMNNIGELFSLIRFLRIPPYNEYKKFRATFEQPLRDRYDQTDKDRTMKALQILLKAILLRRTKKSQIDGEPILKLHERTTVESHAEMDKDQREFYDSLEQRTALKFNKYMKAGTVGKNYSNVLVLLLRLRQACCHPSLIKDHGIALEPPIPIEDMENLANQLSGNVVNMIKEADGAFECPICYDAAENPTIFFPCGHDVCSECFARMTDPAQAIANGTESIEVKCPECREKVDPKRIIRYNIFRKVHLPEKYGLEFGDMEDNNGLVDEDTNSETDSDGDDSESDDDADAQGNLLDFVVPDEADVETESEAEDTVSGSVYKSSKSKDKSAKSKKFKSKKKGKEKKKSKGKGKERKMLSLADMRREGQRNAKARKRFLKKLQRNYVSSAKIDRLMTCLNEIRANDNTEKTIVFSQWTSFLDLVWVALEREGHESCRYDGGMSPKDRDAAVEEFKEKRNVNIMLVSLKAGNAGLNLNFASQVIILDPFWNPYIEEQAIDRAHRIGQPRPVRVQRILIEGTVEDRIIQLQDKKRQLISQALDEEAGANLARLGVRELAYLFNVNADGQ